MTRFCQRNLRLLLTLGLILACVGVGCGPTTAPAQDSSWTIGEGPPSCPGPVIHVIAVENQYGSLVSRLGGQGVRYKSIITNPDADPHEFQTNFQVARDYQAAQLVVENGLGYDDFSDKILDTVVQKPKVVNAGDVLGLKAGDNPHVWYDPDDVDRICQAITAALKELNPAGSAYFDARAKDYAGRLAPYHEAVARIRKRFAGVSRRRDRIDLRADGEGDRPGPDLAARPDERRGGGRQPLGARTWLCSRSRSRTRKSRCWSTTTRPIRNLTSQLRDMAEKVGIPVVGVSETLAPADATFEDWQTFTTQGTGRCTCFLNRAVRQTADPVARSGGRATTPRLPCRKGSTAIVGRASRCGRRARRPDDLGTRHVRHSACGNSSPCLGRTAAARVRSCG